MAVATGCADSVSVPTPSPSSTAETAVCDAIAKQLPATLVGQSKRETDPSSALTAAWGDPPITYVCGVAKPTVAPDAELITVNGVDWLPEQHQAGYVFTTTSLAAPVQMTVPAKYAPETSALADISTVLKQEDAAARGATAPSSTTSHASR